MGIGKKIFVVPVVILVVFSALNISANQECNKWFEQDEDQPSGRD